MSGDSFEKAVRDLESQLEQHPFGEDEVIGSVLGNDRIVELIPSFIRLSEKHLFAWKFLVEAGRYFSETNPRALAVLPPSEPGAPARLERRPPPPLILVRWLSDAAGQKRKRPVRRNSHSFRDYFIGYLIWRAVHAHGLNPTRSRARGDLPCAEGGSACDAAGVALLATEFRRSYSFFQEIWSDVAANKPAPDEFYLVQELMDIFKGWDQRPE